MMKHTVAGMGEVLWDVLPDGKKPGGAPANFAYHVSQFGLESKVVSAVGADSLGEQIISDFKSKGLDCMVETVQYPTGTVQVSLDKDGVPCYDIREGVAWDNIPFTPALESLAASTTAVCFGSLAQRSPVSRATINRFLDLVPDDGAHLKIFDINLRQNFYTADILSTSMHKCNVLKINDEELEIISRIQGFQGLDVQQRCRMLMEKYGLRILILTCGVRGSYVFWPEDVSFAGTPEVEVADTVGAGDSFTAAFVSGILSGLDIRQAHLLAVDTSAYVCTMDGAMPRLPESLTGRVAAAARQKIF